MGEELVVSFILKLLWGFFFFKFIVADRIFFFFKARAFSFDEANRFSCVSYFPLSCIFLSLFSKIFFIGISRWFCVHRCGREKVTLLKVGTDFAVWGGNKRRAYSIFAIISSDVSLSNKCATKFRALRLLLSSLSASPPWRFIAGRI